MIDILSQRGIPVIPVNMEGVMGAGLAKAAKERLPGLEQEYRYGVKHGLVRLNKPSYVPPSPDWPEHNKGVILFATKDEWRNPSRMEWIDFGMRWLALMAAELSPVMNNHVWIPALGCGLGGLREEDVYGMYLFHLGGIPNMHFIGTDRVERSTGDTLFRKGKS